MNTGHTFRTATRSAGARGSGSPPAPPTPPLVSIAVPVYNGERFLRRALDSILAQTLKDFEVLIVDNGSTDGTGKVAAEYVRKDERVRYVRNPVNVGPAKNFSLAFTLARGKYFKVAPHDDIIAPTYLERCVAVLEAEPDVVLVNSGICAIDADDRPLRVLAPEYDASGPRPADRFRELLKNSQCYDYFGVMRKSAVDRLPGPFLAAYGHADGILLSRLALQGRFITIPEPLFLNRDHDGRSGKSYRTYKEYTYFLDPSLRGSIVFPRWRMAWEFLRSLWLFPLPLRDLAAAHLAMARWIARHIPSLAANVAVAGADTARRILPGARRAENEQVSTPTEDAGGFPGTPTQGVKS